MKSQNHAYVPELDQLRGLAAVLVLYYHSIQRGFYAMGNDGWIVGGSPFESLIYEGHTAVSLFLVLSGFLLARGLIGKQVVYGKFLKNRALRVLPLMVFLVVFAIYGSKNYSLAELIAPFLLLTNTPIVFADQTELTGTLWTITVLFQFYLIAPLLFVFMARMGAWRFLLPAVALIFIVKCIVLYANRNDADELFIISYYSIVGRLNQFLVGLALAVLWPTLMRLLAARWAGALALAVSFAAILAYCAQLNAAGGIMEWQSWHVLVPEIEALLWAAFIAGFVAARPLALPWLGRVAAGVGLISYSLYIFHWPIHVIAWNVFGTDEPLMLDTLSDAAWFTTLVVLPASLLVAGLSYWCIERPFLMLRSRYVAPEPAPGEVRRAA